MKANEDAPPRIQAVTVRRGSRSTGVTCKLVTIGTWRAHATVPGLEDALRGTSPHPPHPRASVARSIPGGGHLTQESVRR